MFLKMLRVKRCKNKKFGRDEKLKKIERKKWREIHLVNKLNKINAQKENREAKTQEDVTELQKDLSTVSIALPGSILENAQSLQLKVELAHQIAVYASMRRVDEIIIFDDYGNEAGAKKSSLEDDNVLRMFRHCCVQMGRVLQYLECPPYLRKCFFPKKVALQIASTLYSLNILHHLKDNVDFPYREGAVTNKPVKPGRGSQVNVGLSQDVYVDKLLTPGLRCTVKMLPKEAGQKKLRGILVSQSTPRKETGAYWGYTVRLANSLSQVFTQCPFKNGYDITIGTSDKGDYVGDHEYPPYQHLLVVFGGLRGLESALENDDALKVDDPRLLFDYYLNTIPNQGSSTVRTEDALICSLIILQSKLKPKHKDIEFLWSSITKTLSTNTEGHR